MSAWDSDMEKWQESYSSRLTTDSASENVGRTLAYHPAGRTARASPWSNACAMRTTREYKPNNAGVVRPMARSFHWRCVSMPTWAQASSKVTSILQPRTNHSNICMGA